MTGHPNKSPNMAIAYGAADAPVSKVTRAPVKSKRLGTPVPALVATRVSNGYKRLEATQKFVNPKRCIKLATWNILSGAQVGKLEQVCSELSKYDIELAILTELRLPESGKREVYNLDNTERMHLYYSGGKQRQHGVGFMANEKCNKSITSFEAVSDRIAVLTLNGTVPVTIIAAYAPTEVRGDDEKDYFYQQLQDVVDGASKRGLFILAGDLNAQIGNARSGWGEVRGKYGSGTLNDNGLRLLSFASFNSLVVCNSLFRHKPIHQLSWYSRALKTASMIDYFLVNRRFKSSVHDVRVMRGAEVGSDHHMVRCKIRLKLKAVPRRHPPPRLQLSLLRARQNEEKFQIELRNRFDALQVQEDIEEQWADIRDSLNAATEAICPRTEKRTRQKWVSDNTISLIEQRNSAKLIDPPKARELNKQIRRRLESEREVYWDGVANEMEAAAGRGDQRVLFSTLAALAGKRSRPSTTIRDATGRVAKTATEVLRSWQQHFESLLNCDPPPTLDQDLEQPGPPSDTVSEAEPSKPEIAEAIKRLKSGKAAGPDQVAVEALKAGGSIIVNNLHKLLSRVWKEERVPNDWKLADVVPILKKGDKTRCENYRGISLLSVVGKVLAQVIRARLQAFREVTTREEQCGFRPGRGCIDQIFSVRQVLEERIRCKKQTIAVFIDFKSAFDSVHRASMWKALLAIGVPSKVARVITAFYDGTYCRVKVQGEKTSPFEVRTGVRQGCVLSPLLFNVVIDWIMNKSLAGRAGVPCGTGLNFTDAGYADDIVFLEESEAHAQELLDIINEKAQKLGLCINATKTKCLSTDGTQVHLALRGELIEQVEEFKYLGSLIPAASVAATKDVTARIGSAQAAFASMRWCLWKKNVSLKTKMRIFNATILPILLYAAETWTLLAEDLRKLEAFQMRCLRTILGISLRDRWRNDDIRRVCYQQPPVEQKIRQARLRWFGHVCRMDAGRMPKRLLERHRPPGWKIAQNAPRKTWISQIQVEARRLRFSTPELAEVALDRLKWRGICMNVLSMAATAPVGQPYNLRPRPDRS